MVEKALLLSMLYLFIEYLDPYILSWQCLNRPIVVAPITGLLLGDIQTGIIMGASLESIFMGISAIGGSLPADANTSSIIAVAFTVLTKGDIESGIAISLPIGTLMASFAAMFTPLWSSLAPYWEKQAQNNIKKFTIQNFIITILMLLPNAIVMFIAIFYGVDGLNSALSSLPAWIMTGLNAASGMMVAVGFSILASMIWSNELGCFFFVGYVLTAYLKLDSLPIAIIGAAIAITMFFAEKRYLDLEKRRNVPELVLEDEDGGFFE